MISSKKHIAIIGLGLTGQSMLRFLYAQLSNISRANSAITITLCDSRFANEDPKSIFEPSLRTLADPGIALVFATQEDSFPAECDLVLVSPGIPHSHEWFQAALAQGVMISSDISLFLDALQNLNPSRKRSRKPAPLVVGVTGSNGKSTVVSALGSALNHAGVSNLVLGNIGTPVLNALASISDTTVVILELSSFQLDLMTANSADSKLDIACLLNVSQDHLDRYECFNDYRRSKLSIYDKAIAIVWNTLDLATIPSPKNTAVASSFENKNDCLAHFMAEDTEQAISLSVSVKADADTNSFVSIIQERLGFSDQDEQTEALKASVKSRQRSCPTMLKLAPLSASATWISNACACLSIAALLNKTIDFDLAQFTEGLREYTFLPHRYQRFKKAIRHNHIIEFIDDSKATNVGAAISAIDSARQAFDFIVLIAGGLAKGAELSPLTDAIDEHVDLALLIGKSSSLLSSAILKAESIQCEDLSECLARFDGWLQARKVDDPENGVLLLSPACASMDMFANYQDRGEKFQAAVQSYLQEAAA